MTTLTERAILRVEDEATKPIKLIDAALKRLQTTAAGFKGQSISIQANAGSLAGIERRLSSMQRMMATIGSNAGAGNFSGLTSSLNRVTAAANAASNAVNGIGSRGLGRSVNNGMFGRFPENIPGLAARQAGLHAVHSGANAIRSSGKGILDAASERTLLDLTGIAMPKNADGSNKFTAAEKIAFDEEVKAAVALASNATASKFKTLTAAGMMDIGRTALPNLGDPTKVAGIVDSLGQGAATLSLVYRDAEKGMEGARQGYRALDQMGLADDPKKLDSYMRAWTTGIFASGRDVSAIQMAQTVSRLGGAKMGLNENAFSRLIMLQDEARGQTANLVRTFQNDMVRPDKLKQMQERMISAGVRDKDGNAIFGDELQADPQMYILNRIKPIAEKLGYLAKNADGSDKSDADKAGQLNKILTAGMGYSSSAKTMVLDTILKEKEIRRNDDTIKAQKEKLTPEALQKLIRTDIKSSMVAVESQWQRAMDRLTLAGQPLVAGALGGIAAPLLARIADSTATPTIGTVAMGAIVGGVAYQGIKNMLDNPSSGAMTVAAAAHLGAARALSAAAARLGMAGLASRAGMPMMMPGGVPMTATQIARAKAAALGFPTAAAAAAAGAGVSRFGLANVRGQWGSGSMGKANVALGALGLGGGLLSLASGDIGNGLILTALSAVGLFASGTVAAAASVAGIGVAIDQAFNGGRITSVLATAIDKMFSTATARASAALTKEDKKAEEKAASFAEARDAVALQAIRVAALPDGAERKKEEATLSGLVAKREAAAKELEQAQAQKMLKELRAADNVKVQQAVTGETIRFAEMANKATDAAAAKRALEVEEEKADRAHRGKGHVQDLKSMKREINHSGESEPMFAIPTSDYGSPDGAAFTDRRFQSQAFAMENALSMAGQSTGTAITTSGQSFYGSVLDAAANFAAMVSNLQINVGSPNAAGSPGRTPNVGRNGGGSGGGSGGAM